MGQETNLDVRLSLIIYSPEMSLHKTAKTIIVVNSKCNSLRFLIETNNNYSNVH